MMKLDEKPPKMKKRVYLVQGSPLGNPGLNRTEIYLIYISASPRIILILDCVESI